MANSLTVASSTKQQPLSIMYKFVSTVKFSKFVPLQLSGDNYSSWKPQMVSLIDSLGLLGFINGSIKAPQNEPTEATPSLDAVNIGEAYDIWRTDKAVRGWIVGAISEPILVAELTELGTAREVWLFLYKRFENKEGQSRAFVQKDYFNVQIPLLQAILDDNWGAARGLLDRDPGAAKTWIDDQNSITPLMVAVSTGKSVPFIDNLLKWIPDESVAIKNKLGSTALSYAASVGNTQAATMLVLKMPHLCNIADESGNFPIQTAAKYGQRGMLEHLIAVTRDDANPNPYASFSGLQLLLYTIDAEFFDIAMRLVDKYPYLAELRFPNGNTALLHVIGKSALSNTRHFSFWARFISSYVPATAPPLVSHDSSRFSNASDDDIEHMYMARGATDKPRVIKKLDAVKVWTILERLVPYLKMIKKKSRAKEEALALVKLLSNKLKSQGNFQQARSIYVQAILKAAELGVRDVVEVIIDTFPLSIYAVQTPARRNIFHLAVENRSEDVYNLFYQMSTFKHMLYNLVDTDNNNIHHMAGKLAPVHKLNEISGAALQMQRELQWFKEVERFILPSAREQKNKEGKTPKMVFTEEHKNLKEEGEKWMKDTANSCTISAALIATVMYAAAITVPGGNDGGNGYPIFSKNAAFIIFAISDAISLFASATSLLLFLAILTSRYAEEDFLRVLPKRLIFGLGTLFLSITSMTVSFGATLFLVFGRQNLWVLFPVLILTCLPVTSFALLQFPLLVDLIYSTYGHGIFGKKSDRPFF